MREGRNEDECGEERKVGREKRKIRGETRALRAHMLLPVRLDGCNAQRETRTIPACDVTPAVGTAGRTE